MHWLAMQLADSAFPIGGFSHSSGLEAMVELGEVHSTESFEHFLDHFVRNTSTTSAPFFCEAFRHPDNLAQIHSAFDTTLVSHVARRASLTQGRTLLSTAKSIFDDRLDNIPTDNHEFHFAPLFGAILRRLGLSLPDATQLFLFTQLRSIVSAAVRLGIVGPHEAQRLQLARSPRLETALHIALSTRPEDAAPSAPLMDLFSTLHDQLYSRLFQS